MKDVRLKSDMLRFKKINRYIKGDEILDIGSSEGNVHRLLTEHNPEKKFYTMDEKGSDFNVNLNNLRKINKRFDTVIAGEVIEHLLSPVNFIKFCKSLLKPNGRLILTTPNASGLQYLINPSWCVYYKGYRGHTQAFTSEMLKRIFEDEKLKVKRIEYVNAFWVNNPLQYISQLIKRLRPDILIVGDK